MQTAQIGVEGNDVEDHANDVDDVKVMRKEVMQIMQVMQMKKKCAMSKLKLAAVLWEKPPPRTFRKETNLGICAKVAPNSSKIMLNAKLDTLGIRPETET